MQRKPAMDVFIGVGYSNRRLLCCCPANLRRASSIPQSSSYCRQRNTFTHVLDLAEDSAHGYTVVTASANRRISSCLRRRCSKRWTLTVLSPLLPHVRVSQSCTSSRTEVRQALRIDGGVTVVRPSIRQLEVTAAVLKPIRAPGERHFRGAGYKHYT